MDAANNYIFWDQQDPTAKFHEIIADVAQQIISPAQISKHQPYSTAATGWMW